MLACFSNTPKLATPKRRKTRKSSEKHRKAHAVEAPTPEEEDQLYAHLAPLRESMPTRHQSYVEEVLIGGGLNGIAYLEVPDKATVVDDGELVVFFQGSLKADSNLESCVSEIVKRYNDIDWDMGESSKAKEDITAKLTFLEGNFILLMYDRRVGRVVAARDSHGEDPLYWGTGAFGEVMLFTTDRKLIEAECGDADAFPSGIVFCSAPGGLTGEMLMLPCDFNVPDSNDGMHENGQNAVTDDLVCSATIFRSESEAALQNLHRIGSQHEISAL